MMTTAVLPPKADIAERDCHVRLRRAVKGAGVSVPAATQYQEQLWRSYMAEFRWCCGATCRTLRQYLGRRRRPVHINLEQCQPPDLPSLLFELGYRQQNGPRLPGFCHRAFWLCQQCDLHPCFYPPSKTEIGR